MKYYKDGEIKEFFFATNRAGVSSKPLVAGAASFNEEQGVLDLQFVNFVYRKSYITRVTQNSDNLDFELALGSRQLSIECLYPSLIEKEKKKKTLRAQNIGTARLQLSSVDSIVQIGDNIEFDSPMYIIITGKDASQESKIHVLSINYEGVLRLVDEHNLAGFVAGADKIFVDQASASSDKQARLIIKTGTELKIVKVTGSKSTFVNFECERTINLLANEQVVTVSNGLIVAEDSTSGQIKSIFVDAKAEKRALGSSTTQPGIASIEDKPATEQRVVQDQVLNMQIDPEQVTVSNLEQY